MAIPLTTYGSNLTDLQSGTNAAQGLDYSRANAQDAINQARLEAFLRLRGQQAGLQYQQNNLAAERAMRFAELAQQDKQFGTSEANRLALADKAAASQLAVANATKSGLDPRAFETMLVYNQQGLDKQASARALSYRRKALLDEIAAYKDKGYFVNGPLSTAFKNQYGREPDAKSARTALDALDTQTGTNLGLEPDNDPKSPGFGGYVIPQFSPLVPGPLRGTLPNNTGQSPLPTVQPTTGVQPQIPAMFQGGGSTANIGGYDVVPGGAFDRIINGSVAPAVDAVAPSTVAPRVNLRWDGNNWVQ